MKFIKVKTRTIKPPKFDIMPFFDKIKVKDGDILLITSKILAIHQGRCIPVRDVSKDDLIHQDADKVLGFCTVNDKKIYLTIKDNILIASSGIDESNADDHYILWPKNVDILLKEIHSYIIKKHKIVNLGLISTDSHIAPLRAGIRGIATGSYGFNPIKNYIGTKDIFNRELKMSTVNISDCLASAGVFMMGEGNERTPICIARGVKNIEFGDFNSSATVINPKDDLFRDVLGLN